MLPTLTNLHSDSHIPHPHYLPLCLYITHNCISGHNQDTFFTVTRAGKHLTVDESKVEYSAMGSTPTLIVYHPSPSAQCPREFDRLGRTALSTWSVSPESRRLSDESIPSRRRRTPQHSTSPPSYPRPCCLGSMLTSSLGHNQSTVDSPIACSSKRSRRPQRRSRRHYHHNADQRGRRSARSAAHSALAPRDRSLSARRDTQ